MTLVNQKTRVSFPCTLYLNVLIWRWVFKLKRLPDGIPYHFKARFCVSDDFTKRMNWFFATKVPVVQWTTVCLLLYTVLTEGWAPCQVDYTNTFSGVDLNEDIYIEYPCLSEPRLVVNSVLQLCKSLHGICQAHQTFYENVKAGLEECRFVPSVRSEERRVGKECSS